MSGSKIGAAKAKQKTIEKYGSEEAYREAMANFGKRAKGIKKPTSGFASQDKEKLREISRKGALAMHAKRKALKEPENWENE